MTAFYFIPTRQQQAHHALTSTQREKLILDMGASIGYHY